MNPAAKIPSNFAQLAGHDEQLARLGLLAERYFPTDPNTSILKLRQLTELLAQHVASNVGEFVSADEAQYDLLRRLEDQGILPREIAQLFGAVRRAGNAASHHLAGDYGAALSAMKITWQLGLWFHRTFKDRQFRSGPFIPPKAPKDESAELRAELERLQRGLADYQVAHHEAAQRVESAEAKLKDAAAERSFWEAMAAEAEAAKVALAAQLAAQQAVAAARPELAVALVAASSSAAAALDLDEADTRRLIDEQLRQAGWTADSAMLRYSEGARPERGKNMAIAEWPTASGPADYVLFAGLTPLAAVEAKRKNIDVSGALQQAKRYSRGYSIPAEQQSPGGPWEKFVVPFVFSSNGRPYLRQLATRSGVWFGDVRRPENLSHVLDGWYTARGPGRAAQARRRTGPRRAQEGAVRVRVHATPIPAGGD